MIEHASLNRKYGAFIYILAFCLMCLTQINNLRVFFKFTLLLLSLFNLQMYTHMYKFKPFPILFYLEQPSAVVFGRHVHIFKTEGFLVKVCMCLCICVCSFFFSETTGPMKSKFMWNHNMIGEES